MTGLRARSRPIPAEFGEQGFLFRYERQFAYWRRLSNGDVGIVTIQHERMHQIERLRDDFFGERPSDTGFSGSWRFAVRRSATDPEACSDHCGT